MTSNIDDLITKLKQHLASLGDGRDCRSDNEKALHWAARDTTQRALIALQNPGIEKPTALLVHWEAERAATLEKRAELEQAIAAFTDHELAGDMRAREAEFERQQDVRRQLQRLLQGRLYRAPGETYLPPWAIEERIAELTARRDAAQKTLDGWIKQAETLLAATTVSP